MLYQGRQADVCNSRAAPICDPFLLSVGRGSARVKYISPIDVVLYCFHHGYELFTGRILDVQSVHVITVVKEGEGCYSYRLNNVTASLIIKLR